VATGYIQLLALDKELQIAKQTLKLRREWMGLAEAKYVGGVISKLELSQVRALYDEAAAAVPDLERRVALQENALSILLGRNPGYIVRGDTLNSLNVPRVPADVPSVVLGRRPDVLVAEQDLIAANARIGVAKTEYFPTISLTSKFGLESSQLSNWLDRASGTGELFGGSVAGPLFSGGKISGDVKRTKAIKNEKMSAYLKVVQGALADVDNALVSHQKMGEQLVALRRQVSDLRDYATLAEKRYESGYSSYIEVLYAARSLYAAEIAEAQAKRDVYLALIGVYKAMGGGWPIPHKPYDETLLRVRAATTRETNP
jgi:multidrug efflux system outer membrane protein